MIQMTRLCISVGLTEVDPAFYDGWDGYCPGCDLDAARVGTKLHDSEFDGVTVCINRTVNKRSIRAIFEDAADILRNPHDLLVLYNSGHGGQMPDVNGDELDGKDETLCWWDGEVLDDRIGQYLETVECRVVTISDTCNSGTNFRGRQHILKESTPVRMPDLGIKHLHLGGCMDGRYSYGDDAGGVFTNALLDTLSASRRKISWETWFLRAAYRMPEYQKPVMQAYGGFDITGEALR